MSWWNSSPSFCRLYGLLLIGNVQSHTHTLTKIHLCMKKVKTQPANVDSVSCRAAFALFPVSTAVFSFLILTRIAHVTVYAHTVYLVYAGKHKYIHTQLTVVSKCVCVCVNVCTHARRENPSGVDSTSAELDDAKQFEIQLIASSQTHRFANFVLSSS